MAVYLRPDVVIEPLFNQWVVDLNLVAPLNAAMLVAGSHLSVLRSYVAAPEVHAEGARNVNLAGAPFADIPPSRAAEVRDLLSRTERENADLVALSAAWKQLDAVLAGDTQGLGLDGMYSKVPAPLRGYVELKYDMQHRALARPLEGLLYRSPYYKRAAQSLMLWRPAGDHRPFVYSTPRLPGEDRVQLQLPFDDPRVDQLARLRDHAGEPDALLAGLDDQARSAFAGFLTDTPPPPRPAPFGGPGMRVRYFGHATLLLEGAGCSILVDPAIAYRTAEGGDRFTHADLPERIDLVLITHGHADHFCLEALLQLRHKVGRIVVPRNGSTLVDPSLELVLRATGFRDVLPVEEMQEIPVPGGTVTAIPFLGEHGDLDIRAKTAYAVALGGAAVAVGADSSSAEPRLYDLVRAALPAELDAVFWAMEPHGAPVSWGYGPLFTRPLPRKMDQSRRQRAATTGELIEIVNRLRPRRFYNYAMGLEPWLHHIVAIGAHTVAPKLDESEALVQHCRARGIPAERLYTKAEITLPGR